MNKQEIAAKLKRIEADYKAFREPEYELGLKLKTFDRLHKIFNTSVITPDAAPFVVGRMVEAFDPYTTMVSTIRQYEKLEADLAAIAKAEDAADKLR